MSLNKWKFGYGQIVNVAKNAVSGRSTSYRQLKLYMRDGLDWDIRKGHKNCNIKKL